MKRIQMCAVLILLVATTCGCANTNYSKSVAAGVEQTVKTQQNSDRQDGNSRSTKIEKESAINGFLAVIFCLFSSNEKCN